eukprot:m.127363 g.127363  ORF g.127363 m.127363 type:complete len:871 (-) comp16703_c0_seq2:63-2675(-)
MEGLIRQVQESSDAKAIAAALPVPEVLKAASNTHVTATVTAIEQALLSHVSAVKQHPSRLVVAAELLKVLYALPLTSSCRPVKAEDQLSVVVELAGAVLTGPCDQTERKALQDACRHACSAMATCIALLPASAIAVHSKVATLRTCLQTCKSALAQLSKEDPASCEVVGPLVENLNSLLVGTLKTLADKHAAATMDAWGVGPLCTELSLVAAFARVALPHITNTTWRWLVSLAQTHEQKFLEDFDASSVILTSLDDMSNVTQTLSSQLAAVGEQVQRCKGTLSRSLKVFKFYRKHLSLLLPLCARRLQPAVSLQLCQLLDAVHAVRQDVLQLSKDSLASLQGPLDELARMCRSLIVPVCDTERETVFLQPAGQRFVAAEVWRLMDVFGVLEGAWGGNGGGVSEGMVTMVLGAALGWVGDCALASMGPDAGSYDGLLRALQALVLLVPPGGPFSVLEAELFGRVATGADSDDLGQRACGLFAVELWCFVGKVCPAVCKRHCQLLVQLTPQIGLDTSPLWSLLFVGLLTQLERSNQTTAQLLAGACPATRTLLWTVLPTGRLLAAAPGGGPLRELFCRQVELCVSDIGDKLQAKAYLEDATALRTSLRCLVSLCSTKGLQAILPAHQLDVLQSCVQECVRGTRTFQDPQTRALLIRLCAVLADSIWQKRPVSPGIFSLVSDSVAASNDPGVLDACATFVGACHSVSFVDGQLLQFQALSRSVQDLQRHKKLNNPILWHSVLYHWGRFAKETPHGGVVKDMCQANVVPLAAQFCQSLPVGPPADFDERAWLECQFAACRQRAAKTCGAAGNLSVSQALQLVQRGIDALSHAAGNSSDGGTVSEPRDPALRQAAAQLQALAKQAATMAATAGLR